MKSKSISVTIITGFLGSGKTTLLNNIIATYNDKKIIVIENEFGETNIDKKLISNVDSSKIIELTNGCICCSVKNELGTVLNSLIISGTECDALIIETTGIADPGSIIKMFLGGDRVNRYFKLDSVICLIDAKNFLNSYKEYKEAQLQLIHSDLFIINKIDLVNDNELHKIESILKEFNKKELCKTNFAKVDGIEILERNVYSKSKLSNELILYSEPVAVEKNHSQAFETIHVSYKQNFKKRLFLFWIEQFIHLNSNNIPRIKGVVYFAESDKQYVLQCVNDSFQLYETDSYKESDALSEIVFIGRDINNQLINEALESLISK
ncbi:MAG: GTP-binding protein [Bacteroidales bacterium]|nr:GTP-binding protein [Bacteroidales bacterium]